jgi:hypothetical protein
LERELAADESLRRQAGESDGLARVSSVVLTPDRRSVLMMELDGKLRLPSAVAGPDEAIWHAALRAVEFVPGGVDLAGWAGPRRADEVGSIALTMVARDPAAASSFPAQARWLPIDRIQDASIDPDAQWATERALAQIAPHSPV